MQSKNRWLCSIGTLAAILLISPRLWADPPYRVARLNLIDATVSFHPATTNDWAPAQLNYPLTTGDDLWSDSDSRAEMHIGSTAIQLGPRTDFGFLDLGNQTVQVQLLQGTVDVRIREMLSGEDYEVDTPNVAITLVRPGWYRVDVDAQGDTVTTERDDGEAEVTAAGMAFTVRADQMARIAGTDSPTYHVEDAPSLDSFDEWCLARDTREEHIASIPYVSPEMTGYEDLDYYGSWHSIGSYGSCWIPPHVVAGWAPYRFGHWCWEEPWGWTWIDDEPWGFATCHYGRWVYASDWGWIWVPGAFVAQPCYAPALVAFIGGPGWSLSLALEGGPIGWFPLGPGEIYLPPYRTTNIYIRHANYEIRNFKYTNIGARNVHYINRTNPGAITVISRLAFVNSDPVNRYVARVSERNLRETRVIGMTAPIVPRRESVLGRSVGLFGSGRIPAPPAAIQRRAVVIRRSVPAPPVPFSAQRRVLAEHPGRPPAPATLNRMRAQVRVAAPAVRMAIPRRAASGMHPVRQGLPEVRPPERQAGMQRYHGTVKPAPQHAASASERPGRLKSQPKPQPLPRAAAENRGRVPRLENERANTGPARKIHPEGPPQYSRRAEVRAPQNRSRASITQFHPPERRAENVPRSYTRQPEYRRPQESRPEQQAAGRRKEDRGTKGRG
jgi:hypothetical protein